MLEYGKKVRWHRAPSLVPYRAVCSVLRRIGRGSHGVALALCCHIQEGKKHAHAIVKVKFPTGTIGSDECVALKFHIRTFLRYTDKHEYFQVKPVDNGHSDFECAAGYV